MAKRDRRIDDSKVENDPVSVFESSVLWVKCYFSTDSPMWNGAGY